ncbi:hypothetical protein N7468_003140 [Penicillium chermesinum]|uniref:SAP domain-containing protein n=1 Tax=Penicillium chermesinum TaxID=63820 RepID=A0A9W9TRB8_9EURO|nr:uncharacterized protein N7468_003140 [Penicillium chermesinum]KAJ5238521.1 hypothetical protein N7468_003140 [Penicillium chermesinum]
MAAPRSTSLRALRQVTQHSAPRRCLHITGVQSAQPLNSGDKASLYAARSLPELKQECQRRSIRVAGSKSELIERLSNHDVLQSRAFSIAMRRINPNAFSAPSARLFNTSRSSKAVGDSSTVDFVYMPSLADLEAPSARPPQQIPVLPDLSSRGVSQAPSAPPMKPQIYTVAGAGADVAASPMSEVVDNHAVDIDPFSLTEAEPGIVQELWSGFLDDVLGPKQSSARK